MDLKSSKVFTPFWLGAHARSRTQPGLSRQKETVGKENLVRNQFHAKLRQNWMRTAVGKVVGRPHQRRRGRLQRSDHPPTRGRSAAAPRSLTECGSTALQSTPLTASLFGVGHRINVAPRHGGHRSSTSPRSWNRLTGGLDAGAVTAALRQLSPPPEHPPLYGDGDAATRIAEVVASANVRRR
jgi:hypothetical protein